MSPEAVDQQWFMNQLRDRNKSLRGLARHMDLDPSAVSRMFAGKRKMQMEEAAEIARFLNAPLSEVLSHAGVAIDLDGQPTRVILAAIVNEDGVVDRLLDPRPLPQAVIDRAQAAIRLHGNGTMVAAQVRASSGPLAILDDAVLLFAPTDLVEPSAIGSLSICRLREGRQILTRIERARKTGEAVVSGPASGQSEVILTTAAPVIAIIP